MATEIPELTELYNFVSPDGIATIVGIAANARQHGRDAIEEVLKYYPWADGFLQQCVAGTFEEAIELLKEFAKETAKEKGQGWLTPLIPGVVNGFRPQLFQIYSAFQVELDKPRPELGQ